MGKLELEGNFYKIFGGKMVWNEVLKWEILEGWEVLIFDKCIEKIIDYRGWILFKLGRDWFVNLDDIIVLFVKYVKGGKLINLDSVNRVD